jgi:hypothetical protein
MAFALQGVGTQSATLARWQVPVDAKVFKTQTAVFSPGDNELRAVFYYKEMQSASVEILLPDGRRMATASVPIPHGLAEPTGLYRLKSDASVQVVLFGRVGAKSSSAHVFDLRGGKLRQIFEWSGWDFHILSMEGKNLLAAQDLWRGTLTDLYLWRNGKFDRVNELFPEFYAPEIERQRRFIASADGPFASSFGQACHLGAQALLYSQRYNDAVTLCEQALVAIQSRCCSGASSAPPQAVSADRKHAEKLIRTTIQQIRAAQQRGSRLLSES